MSNPTNLPRLAHSAQPAPSQMRLPQYFDPRIGKYETPDDRQQDSDFVDDNMDPGAKRRAPKDRTRHAATANDMSVSLC